MAIAYSRHMTAEQLQTLLLHLACFCPWAILTGVTDIRFVSVGQAPDHVRFDDPAFDVSLWEQGRVFGDLIEVRWRRQKHMYTLLCIAEDTLPLTSELVAVLASGPEPKRLERTELSNSQPLILWGEWQDPAAEPNLPSSQRFYWYEARIPRFLDYPWPTRTSRLALEVACYRERESSLERPCANGAADFIYRFVRLVAASDHQDQATQVATTALGTDKHD